MTPARFRSLRRHVALALLAVVVGTTAASAQTVGEPAPDFSYTSLTGETLTLSAYRGQVVFVFLFGNTCPFCLAVGNRTETDVHDVYASSGVFQAVGLDLWDSSSSVASVTGFKNQTGITYPLGLRAGSMASLYATTYDRVLVIGPDGILRYKGTSNVSNTLDAAIAVIDDLVQQAVAEESGPEDGAFALHPAYPNPFRDAATLTFDLPRSADVRVEVYNVLGQRVQTLAAGLHPAGRHTLTVDGRAASGARLAPGLYVVRLTAGDQQAQQTLTITR